MDIQSLIDSTVANGGHSCTVNNTILFANVEDFRISGLHIRNHRYWAINLVHCRRGVVRDIDFRADCTWVDENGALHEGLAFLDEVDHWTDEAIRIRNTDGIDLRAGCHDILIENITGFCVDDTVALTALNGQTERLYNVEGDPTDIFNVSIRNVYSRARRAVCLTGGMTNVTLDNINGFDGCRTLIDKSHATIIQR